MADHSLFTRDAHGRLAYVGPTIWLDHPDPENAQPLPFAVQATYRVKGGHETRRAEVQAIDRNTADRLAKALALATAPAGWDRCKLLVESVNGSLGIWNLRPGGGQ